MQQPDPITGAFFLPGLMLTILVVLTPIVGYVLVWSIRRARPNNPDAGQGVAVLVDTSLWFVWFLLLVYLMPRAVRVFQDFDAELPVITTQQIDLSMFVGQYWYLIPLSLMAIAAVDWFVRRFIVRLNPIVAPAAIVLWSLLMVLKPMALIAWCWASIYLPMVALVQKLS